MTFREQVLLPGKFQEKTQGDRPGYRRSGLIDRIESDLIAKLGQCIVGSIVGCGFIIVGDIRTERSMLFRLATNPLPELESEIFVAPW